MTTDDFNKCWQLLWLFAQFALGKLKKAVLPVPHVLHVIALFFAVHTFHPGRTASCDRRSTRRQGYFETPEATCNEARLLQEDCGRASVEVQLPDLEHPSKVWGGETPPPYLTGGPVQSEGLRSHEVQRRKSPHSIICTFGTACDKIAQGPQDRARHAFLLLQRCCSLAGRSAIWSVRAALCQPQRHRGYCFVPIPIVPQGRRAGTGRS